MANTKISALTSASTPVAGTEVLPIVQSSATVKLAISDITPGLSTITAAKGGTGQTSYAVGDLLYANTTTTLAKLPDVATGNALISGGVGVAPSYGKIGLTTHVSGTLPTANGGTNLTSFTANGVVYASSTSALATGSVLNFDGASLKIGTTGTAFGGGERLSIQTANGGASTTGTGIQGTNSTLVGLWNSTVGSSTIIAFAAGSGGSAVGSITTDGTTTTVYNTTSDYRLKTVIGDVTGQGERIDALEPIEYTWNSNGSRTRGFLAHKFQEVYPNSVFGSKDAVDVDGKPIYQSMQASTSEVIADLVAEIKSLRQRLAAANL
jgi:hypothetical protein